MKLFYYNGNNFGDQLNPFIFNKLLPGFFDGNDDEVFVGIGSILGFDEYKSARKKFIFSSGYGKGNSKEYGALPKIDNSYHFLCVRGPLTAKILNIDPKLAITDGAALLRTLDFPPREKSFDYSFIPHKNTVFKYDWAPLCKKAGINYVSPHEETEKVIEAILRTKVVMAESLHAAIVADVFRIPWVPFKTFYSINSFKWKDWTMSLNLPYDPMKLISLFQHDIMELLLQKSLRNRFLSGKISRAYGELQNKYIVPVVVKQLEKLKDYPQYLSEDAILQSKTDALLDLIVKFKAQKQDFSI
jgi:succinoglycan biosynthesis protein ExoV